MNRPKRHHVTPESYLNNFASLAPAQKSPRLSVLIRRTGEIEHQVKSKDIFYRHFYDHLGPLKEVHDRNPFFDGKIVVVGGSEYAYFPYPPELPQKFLQ